MKQWIIVIVATVITLLCLMYGLSGKKKNVQCGDVDKKDARILELERDISRCVNSGCVNICSDMMKSRDDAIRETMIWKEIAENCVDKKIGVKAR